MFRHKYKKLIKGRFLSSQTTPSITPTDIAGLALWFDGTDPNTMYDSTTGGSLVSLNGAVARWEDKSGNNFHAIQTTVNNRPLRKNGFLEFDGTDDSLQHGFTNGGNAYTGVIFAVFKVLSVQGGYRGIIALGNNAPGSMLLSQITSGKWGTFTSGGERGANTGVLFQPTKVYTLVDNAGSGGFFYLNGSADGSYSSADTIGQSLYHIGGDGGQFVNAEINEILVYNQSLSTSDREALESYLINKHNITL